MSKAFVYGIGGGTGSPASSDNLEDLLDGSMTSFTMPPYKTKIHPYRFYRFANLTSVNLGGVKVIGAYAFSGCTNLSELILPTDITDIEAAAFFETRTLNRASFILECENAKKIGDIAFARSNIYKIKGRFEIIGAGAFSDCGSLMEVDIQQSSEIGSTAFMDCTNIISFELQINGKVKDQAFCNLLRVSTWKLHPDSIITLLGAEAFSGFASHRQNPETNIITLDFRNSYFPSINNHTFGDYRKYYGIKYTTFLFPQYVSAIHDYAFRNANNCDFYFYKDIPPILSTTNAWSDATNYNIFVPYNSVQAYRAATNWTAQSQFIKGFAEKDTFEVGDILPIINEEGYGLTWYNDLQCTNIVTIVADSSVVLYCLLGVDKLAYKIKNITTHNCDVNIATGETTYIQGSSVAINTLLTITAISKIDDGIPYLFKVNGVDFTNGDNIIVTEDLEITVLYYDGVNTLIKPVFMENSWDIICKVFQGGIASIYWEVGDTKAIILTDGREYNLRIADMTKGRYALADGSGNTNGVLEFVELVNTSGITSVKFNETTKEGSYGGGGWLLSDIKNKTLDIQLWNMLPTELKDIISEIKLTEYSLTGISPRDSFNKLFLPAETELDSSSGGSGEGRVPGCVRYKSFEYYKLNKENSARIKYHVGTSTANWYWTRSPHGSGASGAVISPSGGIHFYDLNHSYCLAPCFAI